MKSMTGYGRSLRDRGQSKTEKQSPVRGSRPVSSAKNKSHVQIESHVRSVNGRFLEVRVHLPREWAELEPELRSKVNQFVARGTVDLHINRTKGFESRSHVEVNEHLAKEWVRALRELAKATGVSAKDIPIDVIARAPDVVRVVGGSEVSQEERDGVLRVAEEALAALDREREREGQAIRTELTELLDRLTELVGKIEKLALEAPEDMRQRLKSRLERLGTAGLQPPGTDDSRFHQEVALLVDRGDIREEIARLSAHLKVYRELIAKPTKGGTIEPMGKTLDFYAQELLREVNTVGSKSQNANLTRVVVEAKTLVEKIREQVQNVE